MTKNHRLLAVAVTALVVALAACGSQGSDDGAPRSTTTVRAAGTTTADPLQGAITVSAAASLTEAYAEIGKDFETAHPGAEVRFNFDSSGTLAQQILDGAPVDVFTSADEANMAKLTEEDLIDGAPTVIARNQLIIVTKPGNPKDIETLEDLSSAGVVSLCGLDVPCGRFARQALGAAGVQIPETSVTRGQNAKASLTAVTEGDAVAGIVYVTDARAAGDKVEAVVVPEGQNVIATYPAGVLAASKNANLAKAFVSYVASDRGQAVLKEAGFLPPT